MLIFTYCEREGVPPVRQQKTCETAAQIQRRGREMKMKRQGNRNSSRKHSGGLRVFAAFMALSLVSGTAAAGGTVYAAQTGTADEDTRQEYKDTLGEESSTRYAGRVWTDKSVSSEDIIFSGDVSSDQIKVDKGEADFLVTYSALATSQSIVSEQPADVVFILDLSASMCWGTDSETVSASDGSDSRIQAMVDSLNSAVDLLVENNENNRIAVAVFNASSGTLLDLTEAGDIAAAVPDGGEYFSLTSFTGTTGADDGAAEVTCNINNQTANTGSGTNIQAGLYEGMSILADVQETTFTTSAGQVTRIPNVVLMSDGAPTTFASADDAQWTDDDDNTHTGTITRDSDVRGENTTSGSWWNGVSDAAIGGGDNDTPHSANGFMALLTASYMKNVITEHYYGNTDDQSANVYTIGFSTEHQTDGMVEMANLVLNPGDSLSQASESTSEAAVQVAEAWEEYRTGGDPVVQGKLGANGDERSYHVEIADTGSNPDTLDYSTEYFEASSADDLNAVFREIISDIVETAKVPTEVSGSGDALSDGYITYTDPIGRYMEVKDVKALIYGGNLLDVSSTETEGNVTTYRFEGTIDSPVYGTLDASLIEITVEENVDSETGEVLQTLTVRIPAAAIPMRVNEVTLNPDGTVAAHTYNEAYPLRVVYGVGVQEKITDENGAVDTSQIARSYLDQYLTADGKLQLFANEYSGNTDNGYAGTQTDGKTVGDAAVRFTPAKTNPFYYVQKNIPLYTDEDCQNPATGEINENDVYYMEISYYEGTEQKTAVVAREGSLFIDADGRPTVAATGTDGQLELQAGAPRLGNLSDFVKDKDSGELTGTADTYYYPTYQGNGEFLVYLGNNGLLEADVQQNSPDDPSGGEETPDPDDPENPDDENPGTDNEEPDAGDGTAADTGDSTDTGGGSGTAGSENDRKAVQTGDDLTVYPLIAAALTASLAAAAGITVTVIRKKTR